MVAVSMSIAISMTISMTIISIAWLSISRPLAIISMVSISTISVANMSIAISKTISMTIITISRLGLSRPLAIVSMVTISISRRARETATRSFMLSAVASVPHSH